MVADEVEPSPRGHKTLLKRSAGLSKSCNLRRPTQHAVSEDINGNVTEIRNGSLSLMEGIEDYALTAEELSLLAGEMRTVVSRFKL